VAAVAYEGDDPPGLALGAAVFQRRREKRAAGRTGEDRLLAQQLARRCKASETRERSQFGGTKSSPMPSTSQEPGVIVSPVATLGARMDPLGSASTMRVV